MTISSESETRGTAASWRRRDTGPSARCASRAEHHLLAFLQFTRHHFGAAAVADAERHLNGLQLAVCPLHPYASGHGASAATTTAAGTGASFRVVARALLIGEDLADLQPRRFAIFLDTRLPLLLRKPLESRGLPAAFQQDRVELPLLCLIELVGLDEAFADRFDAVAAG